MTRGDGTQRTLRSDFWTAMFPARYDFSRLVNGTMHVQIVWGELDAIDSWAGVRAKVATEDSTCSHIFDGSASNSNGAVAVRN